MERPKILITGAGGRFCQLLVPKLINTDHSVVATDVAQLRYACRCVTASVTDFPTLRTAMWGVNVVLHAAGLHNQLPRTPERPEAYDICYQVNVTGTHNVLRAAQQAGIRKVIFISSMGYYAGGEGYLDESWPAARPAREYYSMSKVLAEDLCRYYAHNHGMSVVSLRPGNFTGDPDPGIDFLGDRLRREDVAQAAFKAITYEPDEPFEAFNVLAGNPFVPEDVKQLKHNPWAVLERYYPGAEKLLKKHGVDWQGIRRVPSIQKARERLGFAPAFTFESYIKTLGSEVRREASE